MHVAHLTLHDFRSYGDIDVALEPGATAFIGRNGQGKTNLVEAIDYLSRLSSHRVATDALTDLSGQFGDYQLLEEIGRGVDKLDLDQLGAQAAYTLDGENPGEVVWETFSADEAVVTIEGLSADGSHPLQQAWETLDVPECGYCQAGQIMAAAALLAQRPKPTDADIDAALERHLCRCGTHNRIRRAIHRAAHAMGASS